MKSFLILGLSTFGCHLCKSLMELNCEVMIVDKDSDLLQDMASYAECAKIADCTKPENLKSFGVPEFDTCFVCLGGHFGEALETTYLLKEMGAKKIISEVNRDIESKFLLSAGADSIVYPELDSAVRLAEAESNDSIFSAVPLTNNYSILEIATPKAWLDKSVKQLDVRAKHRVSIIAYKKGDELTPLLSPDYVFSKEEHLLVLGHISDIKKLL